MAKGLKGIVAQSAAKLDAGSRCDQEIVAVSPIEVHIVKIARNGVITLEAGNGVVCVGYGDVVGTGAGAVAQLANNLAKRGPVREQHVTVAKAQDFGGARTISGVGTCTNHIVMQRHIPLHLVVIAQDCEA